MIGGGGAGLSVGDVEEAGYEVHTDLKRLADRELSASRADPVNPVAVLLGKGHLPYRADAGDSSAERPALADMVDAALDRLSADPDGFFLLVEAARIDHASHDNDIRRALAETVDLLEAVERTLARLDGAESDDVLVVLTADHETGGLSVSRTAPIGTRPDVEWSTGGHTARPVPVYARGPFSEHVIGTLDNTDLYSLMLGRPLIKD
jgi:alkaline phosphatase